MKIEFDINKNVQKSASAIGKDFSLKGKEKLKKAAFDFQALLIGQMLKSMRETQLKEENGEDSYGSEIYSELFDIQLAQNMSKTGKFGIAEMLYKKLTGEDISEKTIIPKNPTPKDIERLNNSIPKETNQIVSTNKSDVLYSRISRYDDIIESASKTFDVDPNLIKAVIASESGGDKFATSKANAKGLMQLMDETAKDMGVSDIYNPVQNINGGTKYLKLMMNKYNGNKELALAAYNAGPGAVDKFNGVPPYKETKNYIKSVKSYLTLFTQKDEEIVTNE